MRRAVHLFGTALRETGQALDRFALQAANNDIYRDTFSRHRPIMNLFDQRPEVAAGVFVAPSASVIGKVLLNNTVSIWYGAVVRADKNVIEIGHATNIQDRAVISTVTSFESGFPADVRIGESCTIGHGALITSCTIGDEVLIGQGAIIQQGCDIGDNVTIAAGAVVLPNTVIPAGQLWAGNPAKYVRDVSEEEMKGQKASADVYSELAEKHSGEFLPYGTLYQQGEKLQAKNA